jgi:hypothetical protein
LYVSDLHQTEEKNGVTFQDIDGAMLVELRTGGGGKGSVSMFPPSLHPGSGEVVEWDEDGEPQRIDGDELKQKVSELAVATLLVRHYPRGGGRHQAFLVLGGLLARARFSADDIELFAEVVANAAGDEEVQKRIEAAASAVDRLVQNEDTPGLPRFAAVWGQAVAERAAEWLGLNEPTQRAGSRSRRSRFNIHSWDDPDRSLLDDRRGDLPDFPLEVLQPPTLQDLVIRAARDSGTRVDHVVVPLLGIAGSLIGSSRRVKAAKTWSAPMSLWTAVVGFSGTGKTPGLDVSRDVLAAIEAGYHTANLAKLQDHEQKCARAMITRKVWEGEAKKALKECRPLPPMPDEAKTPEPPTLPRLYVSDTTIEAIAKQLQSRPQGGLLVTDELARLFLNMSRYSTGQDDEFWLEAWDGKAFHQLRLGREPVDLEHLLIGMVGGMQPDKLALSFKGAADGMYARMLFAWPQAAKYRPLSDDGVIINTKIEHIFKKLSELADRPEGRFVPLSANARTAFDRLRREVSRHAERFDGREREWWAKMPAHTLRLAGVLAYLYWILNSTDNEPAAEPEHIEADDMRGAITLVQDYFWPHARAALRQIGLSDQHAEARRVLKWLAETGKAVVSREEVRCEALSKRLDADATQDLLERLGRAGWLRKLAKQNQSGPGRPSERWEVNPTIRAGG